MNARVVREVQPSWKAGFLVALLAGCIMAVHEGDLSWLGLGPAALLAYAAFRSPKFLFWVLLATIPFSAEVMLTETLGTDLPDEPLMWLLTIVLFLQIIIYRQRITENNTDRILVGLLTAHFAWILLVTALSPDFFLSLKYAAAKLWYLFAFTVAGWLLLRSVRDLHSMAWILIWPMTFVCSWILWTHGKNGFSFDSVNAAVQPFFRNHVNYGAILVCLLPMPVVLFLHKPRFRPLLACILILWLAAAVLSYSRGAWVAAGIGILTVIAIRFRILLATALCALALLTGLFWYFIQGNRYLDFRPDFDTTIYHQDFREHLRATYRLKDLSTAERFHRWIAGARMVQDAPFFGHGPNRFYPAYKPYTVSAFRTYVSGNPEKSTVHNYFLLLAVEQGLPGLLVFLVLLWRVFYLLSAYYRGAVSTLEKHVWLGIGAILAMIIWLNMLSDLVETDKIGSLFFLCIGLVLVGPGLFHESNTSPREKGNIS